MPIIRANYEDNGLRYVTVSQAIARDPLLKPEDKGVMLYLLSCRDDWTFYNNVVQRELNIGRDKLNAILNRLEQAGYIKFGERIRNKNGQLAGRSITVVENPNQCGFPAMAEPVRVSSNWFSAPTNTLYKDRGTEEGSYNAVGRISQQCETSIADIETWTTSKKSCPDCGSRGLLTNGQAYKCDGCEAFYPSLSALDEAPRYEPY